MVHEEKKVAKIIEELTMYFFSIGANTISSKIEKKEENVKITFRSDYLPEYEEDIQYLEECLGNEQKNAGMEDVYWELIGSGDPGESSQLLLLAMLVDRYEIHKSGNEIELHLYKKCVI
uniref:hypothetical protein n=1 Tax=Agathobacter sp. TaxID=2021311 RepID=UPI004057BC3D